MHNKALRVALALCLMLTVGTALAQPDKAPDQPIRIAIIDPFSGPFAKSGDLWLTHLQYLGEQINADGGILGRKLQFIPFDDEGNAQKALQILRKVADKGIHYIAQGSGSFVSGALISGVNKHNKRHPDKRILYLNYAAMDPKFTNQQCSFWHFRFDTSSTQRLDALVKYVASQDSIHKVFLINQDYSFGQYIAQAAPKILAQNAPDVEVVGNVLHPVGRIKDFSPYVADIAASGADAVITGNWLSDLTLLIKAGMNAGLDVQWLTYFGGTPGTPTALGSKVAGHLTIVSEWQKNLAVRFDASELQHLVEDFQQRTPYAFYFLRGRRMLQLLRKAMAKADSTEPLQVAYAMEGLSIDTPLGRVTMRTDNHQLLQPLFVSTLATDYLEYQAENTGLGFVMDMQIPAARTRLPTTCDMQRPARP